jgi:hypothetical protein
LNGHAPVASRILVSWSEIDTGRQCPFKHHLAWKERWTPPEVSRPLATGQLWHQVLEAHYTAIDAQEKRNKKLATKHPSKTQLFTLSREPVANLLHNGGDAGMRQTDEQQTVEWMYDGYTSQWGLDPDWTIIAVEHEAEVQMSGRFWLKMKIDLIISDGQGRLWLIDHKSGQNLPKEKDLAFDDQFGLYTWGMRRLGHPVFGAIYNAARTQRNVSVPQPLDSRFQRILMHRTDHELDTIAFEALQTVQRLYSPRNAAERHPSPDMCKWRCPFTEACLAGRKGVDEIKFLQQAGFTQEFPNR